MKPNCKYLDLENETDFGSETNKYRFNGTVHFGQTGRIVQCIKQDTREIVAIKLVPEIADMTNREKQILRKIKEFGPDNYNIVKFYEDFNYKTKHCFVFEKLDIDLLRFTETIVGSGLHLSDIRLIAKQVLVSLDFLHSNGIVHRCITPNNIMLVDRSSLKVKLIDMGFSEEIGSMSNIYTNPVGFMPPEVIMRKKPDASSDMWCLGLTLIYFYLKALLFDCCTLNETLAAIVKMLGEPHCSKTFSYWKNVIKEYDPVVKLQSLDDLLEIRPTTQDPAEREDLLSFIDFLKQMLVPTPQERITSAAISSIQIRTRPDPLIFNPQPDPLTHQVIGYSTLRCRTAPLTLQQTCMH
uniref:Protein kinase domain-containing protein n=1 Tax=Cyprinodon variegatus TaxID=28743 RepID=A0A3Q2CKB5_CYPVA